MDLVNQEKLTVGMNEYGCFIQLPRSCSMKDAKELASLMEQMPDAVKEIDEIFDKYEKISKKHEKEYKENMSKIQSYHPGKKPLWKKICDPFYSRIVQRK